MKNVDRYVSRRVHDCIDWQRASHSPVPHATNSTRRVLANALEYRSTSPPFPLPSCPHPLSPLDVVYADLFQVLGTPTREEIRAMNSNYSEFKFPQIKAHPWKGVFRARTPPEVQTFSRECFSQYKSKEVFFLRYNRDGTLKPNFVCAYVVFVRSCSDCIFQFDFAEVCTHTLLCRSNPEHVR